MPVYILGVSPRSAVKGCHRPREFSALAWIARSFEAATIFIAFVIFWIFFTLFIRFLTECTKYYKRTALPFATDVSPKSRKNCEYFIKEEKIISNPWQLFLPIWVEIERTPKGACSLPTKPNNLVVSMLKRKTMASNKKWIL